MMFFFTCFLNQILSQHNRFTYKCCCTQLLKGSQFKKHYGQLSDLIVFESCSHLWLFKHDTVQNRHHFPSEQNKTCCLGNLWRSFTGLHIIKAKSRSAQREIKGWFYCQSVFSMTTAYVSTC